MTSDAELYVQSKYVNAIATGIEKASLLKFRLAFFCTINQFAFVSAFLAFTRNHLIAQTHN